MGILSDALESRSGLLSFQDFTHGLFFGTGTTSGINVTPKKAMHYPALASAVKILAKTIGSLPLKVFEPVDRGKEERPDHPLSRLLRQEPNPEMTAYNWRQAMVGHIAIWGNHYSQIVRNGRGDPAQLWPLPPDRVVIKRDDNGDLFYKLSDGNGRPTLTENQVLHIRGFGFNGIRGFGLIELHSDAIGLGIASEEYGARFFENDSRPGGFLSFPEGLSEEAQKRIGESWKSAHEGTENAHRVAVLEEGASWEQTGVPPETAQFLETREFQVDEVARIFDIPPHRLARLENSNFSNVEQQALDFVKHTIRPWLVMIEQELNRNLLSRRDRSRGIFVEHVIEGLLRGDSESRAEFYQSGINNGWLSINDVRRRENLNAVEGGDEHYVPLNLQRIGQRREPAEPTENDEENQRDEEQREALPEATESEARLQVVADQNDIGMEEARTVEKRRRVARSFIPLLEDQFGAVVSREVRDVREIIDRNLTRRDINSLRNELGEFFFEDHNEFTRQRIQGPIRTLMESIIEISSQEIGANPEDINAANLVDEHLDEAIRGYVGDSYGQLMAIIRGEDDPAPLSDQLVQRLEEWDEKRADKEAPHRTYEAANEATLGTFVVAGVTRKIWTTVGANCPLCNSMAGRVVGVEKVYLREGDELDPEGTSTYTASSPVLRPPLHKGCDCLITSA